MGEGLYQRITGLKILILNTIGLQIRLNRVEQGTDAEGEGDGIGLGW